MTAQQAWGDPRYDDVDVPGDGPHDVEDLDPEVTLAAGTVDFGAVRVPVPERGTVTVEPTDEGRMQAVHVSVPEGRLSVSALAAPRSSRLWPDLVKEIDSSLREGGARVRSFQGDWGRELHATSGAATSRFVGVDGARWMLYGVATGPTRDADALDEQLRRMLRGTIVVRGRSPYPVRTVLPLEVPEHLATADTATAGTAADPEQPATTAVPAAAHTAATTVLPVVHRPIPAAPTESRPGAGPAPAAPAGYPPRWPNPDDRPTDIRPGHPSAGRDETPPTERWATTRDLGSGLPGPAARGSASRSERVGTGPPPPPTGGRRRLREADPQLPEPQSSDPQPPEPQSSEPQSSNPSAVEFEPRAGRRRLPEPSVAQPRPGGRRPVDSLASPASGRRRAADGAMTTVAIPVYDVLRPGRHADLRPGRHAAAGPAPAPDREAETQPWTAFPPAVADTAPRVVTARDQDPESATVPLPLTGALRPAPPSGRHHRPD